VPAKKRKIEEKAGGEKSSPQEKLARLLALYLVKGEKQAEQIRMLSCAGFTNTEIAELLGTTSNVVNVTLFRNRTKK
jgi:DNA-directed RNA polymerase specialized sigma24 family protein